MDRKIQTDAIFGFIKNKGRINRAENKKRK